MKSSELQSAFLKLVRLGIGHGTGTESVQGSWTSQAAKPSARFKVQGSIDWQGVKDLAERQGLSAVVLDGIEQLRVKSEELRVNLPEKILLVQWIGEVSQLYEQRYEQYLHAIADLAGFYNSHGFKMMVLKGYACSLDWPKPEHRPCGDIDIWQFGQQKEADAALAASSKFQDSGSKIDSSHHHHTVFSWRDFTVENHYDFISVYHHKSHVAYEAVLKEFGKDDSHFVELYGEKVYLPSPNLHALFLLKHAMLHFVGTEITFRHLLDWAFFVKQHGKVVDWKMVLGVLEEHGMMPMFNILNAICVEDLGFEASLFPKVQFDPFLKERVVREIFASVYQDDSSEGFLKRQINRFHRWKANGWKHELCYNESRWSAFWSGVCGHLRKPGSI